MLEMRRGNARAVAASHQHAILGLAEVGDAHGEPDSDRRQRDRKGERRDVRQHAMTKIVSLVMVALIARQIVRLAPGVPLTRLVTRLSPQARRLSEGARPELEHAMLFFRSGTL